MTLWPLLLFVFGFLSGVGFTGAVLMVLQRKPDNPAGGTDINADAS